MSFAAQMVRAAAVARDQAARALSTVAPGAAGRFEWALSPRPPTSRALNGQVGRQQLVRAICSALEPQAVIETGTFRGTTTEFLSVVSGAPVYSVERERRYHAYARRRLKGSVGIELALGDSREFLRALAADPEVPKEAVFFYLDAHWGPDLPLREELEVIMPSWRGSVVMIDDFQVPGDVGYQYDDYGPGCGITAADLPWGALAGASCLVPSLPSSDETGARAGCLVVAPPELASKLVAGGRVRPMAP